MAVRGVMSVEPLVRPRFASQHSNRQDSTVGKDEAILVSIHTRPTLSWPHTLSLALWFKRGIN